jgi:hypothetical protein
MLHRNIKYTNGNHYAISFEYSDSAARTGASGFDSGDLGSYAWQKDNNSIWMLTAITPTWAIIGWLGTSGNVSINTATGVITVTGLTIASEAQGDIIKRGASAWERLAIGTKYQTLAVNSGATSLEYVSTRGAASFFIGGEQTASATMVLYVPIPYAFKIGSIRVTLGTPATGSTFIVDVHYHATVLASAVTIFTNQTNRPTIADGGYAATSGTPDIQDVAKDGYLSFFVDQHGSTVKGSDMGISIIPA